MKRIDEKTYNGFIEYVIDFYGRDGLYKCFFKGAVTNDYIKKTCQNYMRWIEQSKDYDEKWSISSVDREFVRDAVIYKITKDKTEIEYNIFEFIDWERHMMREKKLERLCIS